MCVCVCVCVCVCGVCVCVHGMYDYAVSTMSILSLLDIQLTFDWIGIETLGAYPHKS